MNSLKSQCQNIESAMSELVALKRYPFEMEFYRIALKHGQTVSRLKRIYTSGIAIKEAPLRKYRVERPE